MGKQKSASCNASFNENVDVCIANEEDADKRWELEQLILMLRVEY